MAHVIVIGAGPAGVFAAYRAAGLGAKTTLVTRRIWRHGGQRRTGAGSNTRAAARLLREARQLDRYGIAVGEPELDYPRLLARVREVAGDVRTFRSARGPRPYGRHDPRKRRHRTLR